VAELRQNLQVRGASPLLHAELDLRLVNYVFVIVFVEYTVDLPVIDERVEVVQELFLEDVLVL